MSYVVSIVRPDAYPIDAEAVAAAVAEQEGFEALQTVDAASVCYVWRKTTLLNLSDGTLWVANPGDEALAMMQTLARRLGAEVRGEEGEDLSNVPLLPGDASRQGCAGPAVMILIGASGLLASAGWQVLRWVSA